MKKLFVIFFVCILLCGTLLTMTSCHGSKGRAGFTVPESFDETKEYDLVFWAKNDTNNVQKKAYQDAISRFTELYPNIHITMKSYTDYARIYQDVITNISTNTTPNICITYPDHIATYLTGDHVVAPLSYLAENEKYGLGGSELKFDSPTKEEIVPGYLRECYVNDELYAIPFMRSSEALYMNKTYIEALGYEIPEKITWDFVWEVSEKAMEKDEEGNYKINGQKVMIPFIYKSTDNMMIQMLRQRGGGYSREDGTIELFNEVTSDILKEVARACESGSFSTFKISSYPGNFLNAGQCIFAIDSTAGATWMGSNAPLSDLKDTATVDFETLVRPVPQSDNEEPVMISQGPSICVFNKEDPNEVLASWLFAEYLLTNEVQIEYSKSEGYVPVTTKAQQDPSYLDYLSRAGEDNNVYYPVKMDAVHVILDNLDHMFVTPVFNGSASLRQAAGDLIENVVKSVRKHEEITDEYIEELYGKIDSLYRLSELNPNMNTTKKEFGALPDMAKWLLVSLGAVWVVLIVVFTVQKIRTKKK